MPSLNTDPTPTVSFSLGVEGWPSFYSYKPEFMMGMNNFFYSWSGGNLYQHNSDAVTRNNYYGTQYNTEVITVFNEAPISNLLWKTVHLEGTHPWYAEFETDLHTGLINKDWFVKKEGAWFAFVRNFDVDITDYNNNPSWFDARSITGVGSGVLVASTVVFAFTTPQQISVGDYIFNIVGGVPSGQAQITNIQYDTPVVGSTTMTLSTTAGLVDGYFGTYKNFQAESNGILGHYNYVKLVNDETVVSELFAVESEVMASFPYP